MALSGMIRWGGTGRSVTTLRGGNGRLAGATCDRLAMVADLAGETTADDGGASAIPGRTAPAVVGATDAVAGWVTPTGGGETGIGLAGNTDASGAVGAMLELTPNGAVSRLGACVVAALKGSVVVSMVCSSLLAARSFPAEEKVSVQT